MADIVGPSVLPLIVQLACSLLAALEDSLRTKVGVGHHPDLAAHSSIPGRGCQEDCETPFLPPRTGPRMDLNLRK